MIDNGITQVTNETEHHQVSKQQKSCQVMHEILKECLMAALINVQ